MKSQQKACVQDRRIPSPFLVINESEYSKDGICITEYPMALIESDGETGYPRIIYDKGKMCIRCGH